MYKRQDYPIPFAFQLNFVKSVKSILTDLRNYIKTGCIAMSTDANKNTISMFLSIDIFSPIKLCQ